MLKNGVEETKSWTLEARNVNVPLECRSPGRKSLASVVLGVLEGEGVQMWVVEKGSRNKRGKKTAVSFPQFLNKIVLIKFSIRRINSEN